MLADQGWSGPRRPEPPTTDGIDRRRSGRRGAPSEEKGRLSNPVQRRLTSAEIEQLIHLYREGASIDALARRYKIHRTTVIHHLDRAGIARRRVVRKMTDASVALAAERHAQGASLALVASEFAVHERTLARELLRAGTSIRPRRGWRH